MLLALVEETTPTGVVVKSTRFPSTFACAQYAAYAVEGDKPEYDVEHVEHDAAIFTESAGPLLSPVEAPLAPVPASTSTAVGSKALSL
jgi:hypothetical protein